MRWFVRGSGLVLFALLIALAALAVTERGARGLVGVLQARSGGLLEFHDVRGTLAGGLEIGGLTIVTEASRTEITEIRLSVNPAALLAGQVRLPVAEARSVKIELLKPPDPDKPFEMPRLPMAVPLRVVALSIDTLEVARQGQQLWSAGPLRVGGFWFGTQVRIDEATASIAGVSLAAAGELALEPGLPLDASLRWRWPAAGLSGSGPLRGDLAALRFEQALLVPEAVEVQGTLAQALDAPALEATVTWAEVTRPVSGLGALTVSAGRGSVAGWLDGWRARATASISAPGWPAQQAEVTASGDLRQVRFDALSLASRAGKVRGTGSWDFAGTPRIALELAADGVDPGFLRPGLTGRIAAEFAVVADPDGHTLITVRRLAGTLMGRPLTGAGVLEWRDGTLDFRNVDLRAGRNQLRADGRWGARLGGRFELDAPELRTLWPGLDGALDARAELSGTRAAPVVRLRADGGSLAFDGYTLERFRFAGDLDRLQRGRATLDAGGLVIQDIALGDLAGSVEGTLARHRLELALAGGDIEATLAATGKWNGQSLALAIHSATLAEERLGGWQLAGEPAASIASDRASLAAHCWRQPPAELCLEDSRWAPGELSTRGRLAHFDLAGLGRWLPEGLALAGEAGGSAEVALSGNALAGTMAVELADAEVRYNDGDEVVTAPLRTARGTLTVGRDGASARATLAGDAGLLLELDGTMAAPVGMDGALNVSVTGALPDIAPFLPFFAADLGLAEIAGGLAIDAGVGGTLAAPEITGVARFTDGSFVLPAWGVKVEAIDVSMLGDGSSTLRLRGSARAGGMLTLSGEVDPLAEGGPTAAFRVSGNRVQAVNLPDLRVLASPKLTVSYAEGRFSAGGSVLIPAAKIVVRELPASSIRTSPDVVVHGRAAPATPVARGPAVGGEVQLELGRDVELKGFGLETRIEGKVRLAASAAEELRGYGTLRLKDGKFGAYGRELTIDRGTLGFNGPLDDPVLNVRASRQVEWEGRFVKAGIEIRGTASRTESRVYSDPAMAEADALSYLISGQPLQTASASDRSTIAGAALALGAQQAAPLTQRLGNTVALDELSVTGSSLEESEVVAGKQLGEKLYLRFSYGLFNRIGTVLARYRIGRRMSIEASSGEDQALDLVYSVERD